MADGSGDYRRLAGRSGRYSISIYQKRAIPYRANDVLILVEMALACPGQCGLGSDDQ